MLSEPELKLLVESEVGNFLKDVKVDEKVKAFKQSLGGI